MVQWLRQRALTVEDPSLILGRGTLVGELRSHEPCGVAKKRKRKRYSSLLKDNFLEYRILGWHSFFSLNTSTFEVLREKNALLACIMVSEEKVDVIFIFAPLEGRHFFPLAPFKIFIFDFVQLEYYMPNNPPYPAVILSVL